MNLSSRINALTELNSACNPGKNSMGISSVINGSNIIKLVKSVVTANCMVKTNTGKLTMIHKTFPTIKLNISLDNS